MVVFLHEGILPVCIMLLHAPMSLSPSLIPPRPQVPPCPVKVDPKQLFFSTERYVLVNLGASELFLWAQVRLVHKTHHSLMEKKQQFPTKQDIL